MDYTVTATPKHTEKLEVDAGQKTDLKDLIKITGPVQSVNLDQKNKITLSPKTKIIKSNFEVYSQSKTHKDLRIATALGVSAAYDIYNRYNKIYKSLLPVGKNQKQVTI